MILAILFSLLFFSSRAEISQPVVASAAYKSVACDFFTHDNAMRVLGAPSIGSDGGMTEDADGKSWKCTFTPKDGGEHAPKLFFMIMTSTSEDAAKSVFKSVRDSNKNHNGFEEWPGFGDEAIVQSDAPNLHFVMVRKGAKTIRIKINPASGVSLENVKAAAASLIPKMSM